MANTAVPTLILCLVISSSILSIIKADDNEGLFVCDPYTYASCAIGAAAALLLDQQINTHTNQTEFKCQYFVNYTTCLGNNVAGGAPCTVNNTIPEWVTFLGSELDCENDDIQQEGLHDGCATEYNTCTVPFVNTYFDDTPSGYYLQIACEEFATWSEVCNGGVDLQAGCLSHGLAFNMLSFVCGEVLGFSDAAPEVGLLIGGSGDPTTAPVIVDTISFRMSFFTPYNESQNSDTVLKQEYATALTAIITEQLQITDIISSEVENVFDTDGQLSVQLRLDMKNDILSSDEVNYATAYKTYFSHNGLGLTLDTLGTVNLYLNEGDAKIYYLQTSVDAGTAAVWVALTSTCSDYFTNTYCLNGGQCGVYQPGAGQAAKFYCECTTDWEGLRCDLVVPVATPTQATPVQSFELKVELQMTYTDDLDDVDSPVRAKIVEEVVSQVTALLDGTGLVVLEVVLKSISRGSVVVVPEVIIGELIDDSQLSVVAVQIEQNIQDQGNAISIGGESIPLVSTAELITVTEDGNATVSIPIVGACFLYTSQSLCQNGGECYSNSLNQPTCRCTEGYTGTYCDPVPGTVFTTEVLAAIVVISALLLLAAAIALYACFKIRGRGRPRRYIRDSSGEETRSYFSSISRTRYNPGAGSMFYGGSKPWGAQSGYYPTTTRAAAAMQAAASASAHLGGAPSRMQQQAAHPFHQAALHRATARSQILRPMTDAGGAPRRPVWPGHSAGPSHPSGPSTGVAPVWPGHKPTAGRPVSGPSGGNRFMGRARSLVGHSNSSGSDEAQPQRYATGGRFYAPGRSFTPSYSTGSQYGWSQRRF